MKRFAIYLFSLLISLTACEKEVTNIKLPSLSSKLVVTSFISPQDTLLRVSILKSKPAIGKTSIYNDDIQNATVRMSDGTTTINFTYNTQEHLYVADAKNLPIIQGNTYFLEVTDPEGRKAEASCTVPVNQAIVPEIIFDSVQSQYGNNMEYYMTMQWKDTPGEINFYRLFAEIATRQGGGPTYSHWVYFGNSNDITLYSDNRLDGAKFASPKGHVWKPFDATTLYAYLLNTDEHYYRYHQSLHNHSNVDGNPFAEPVLLYSNMNGGLGVFGSYNRNIVTVPLK